MRFLFRAVLGAVVFFATILILALAGASYWAYGQYKAPGPLKETTTINIPRGSSVYGISQTLLHHGIVDPAAFTPVNIFVHASGITGQAQTLKAGEYEFTPHISIKEILDKLESGQVVMRQITIREGLTNHEIVQLLNQEKDIEKQNTPQYPEGTLLPETYSYASGDSNADILLRMNLAMEQVLQEAWENRAEGLPLETKEEALVLASIIEKETAIASERRRVAGVFVNRLRVGIALQTDPTVIYALTEGKPQN
ncbi:MAG: endolytic transglycosylase MltG, partial [Alphaproteobacteria bacterium]